MPSQLHREKLMKQRLLEKVENAMAKMTGIQINVPSIPRRLAISSSLIDEFLLDPVMGIYVVFNEVLDEFQKVRARLSWFTPRLMDSSGLSSAKTLNLFLTFNLRCVLMEGRIAAVYYPSWGQGQKTFWRHYTNYLKKSAIFRAQVGRMSADQGKVEGKAQLKGPSCWSMEFRNNSQILLPAPGFLQDAKTQAGLRLNDLGIDEINKVAAMGTTGIDDQLIGRCTLAVYNKNHPVWQNKHLFLSTAEDTMHPGYQRFKNFKEQADNGNPEYAVFSGSFKDYSNLLGSDGRPFKIHREDNIMRDLRINKSRSAYLQEALGIWSDNGKAFYAQEYIDNAMRYGADRQVCVVLNRDEDPEAKRHGENCFYFLGADPAKADTQKADDGAMVVLRAVPKAEVGSQEVRDWFLDFVWAHRIRKADATQWSGIIHRKEEDYRMAGIMLDPGGGGLWIRPELRKGVQLINGQMRNMVPIASPEDERDMPIRGKFILSMFKLMDPSIKKTWGDMKLANIDGLYDVAHTEFQEAWSLGLFNLPPRIKDLPKDATKDWPAERLEAYELLETMGKQIVSINLKTDENGATKFTKNGAKQFMAKGRKDFAYAGMYAYIKFLTWLKDHGDDFNVSKDDEEMCG